MTLHGDRSKMGSSRDRSDGCVPNAVQHSVASLERAQLGIGLAEAAHSLSADHPHTDRARCRVLRPTTTAAHFLPFLLLPVLLSLLIVTISIFTSPSALVLLLHPWEEQALVRFISRGTTPTRAQSKRILGSRSERTSSEQTLP